MADSVFGRRAGAAAGTWVSIVLGFLGTVVAAHIFSTTGLGLYAIVIAATAFFQTLLDLTIEEALIKFGFRYVTREDWGRLHRLFRRTAVFKALGAVLAAACILVLAMFSETVFQHDGLTAPLAVAALIPLVQWPENVFAVPLMLHGRYDLRASFLALSMGLRLAGIAAGAPFGLVWAIVGIAIAQAIATLSIMVVGAHFFRRFPRAEVEELGGDRSEILRFIVQSTGATGMLSLRAPISPMLLGMVTTVPQVAYFRVAQAPQQGFNAISAPIRLVLLAEQTRDWERGNREKVFAGIRRYTVLAALGCVVLLPVLLVFMGPIVRLLFSPKNAGAIGAARIIVVAGAVQFLVGWSKSFAVTCGRPQLRIWTYGIETLVLVPLLAVLGWKWGAVGAACAVLASSVVFALSWVVLYRRIRNAPQTEPGAADSESATMAELGALL